MALHDRRCTKGHIIRKDMIIYKGGHDALREALVEVSRLFHSAEGVPRSIAGWH